MTNPTLKFGNAPKTSFETPVVPKKREGETGGQEAATEKPAGFAAPKKEPEADRPTEETKGSESPKKAPEEKEQYEWIENDSTFNTNLLLFGDPPVVSLGCKIGKTIEVHFQTLRVDQVQEIEESFETETSRTNVWISLELQFRHLAMAMRTFSATNQDGQIHIKTFDSEVPLKDRLVWIQNRPAVIVDELLFAYKEFVRRVAKLVEGLRSKN